MSLQAIETRSIEDSLSHGLDAVSRAESLVRLILDDLNGNKPEAANEAAPSLWGLVSTADALAGRIEALVPDLNRVRARLVASKPKGTGEINTVLASYPGLIR
jgi:hypothetical protein